MNGEAGCRPAETEEEIMKLTQQLNLVCAGLPMEIVLPAVQNLHCANICLIGSMDESLSYIDAAQSDLRATVRKHHAWYNSPAGQITSGSTPEGVDDDPAHSSRSGGVK